MADRITAVSTTDSDEQVASAIGVTAVAPPPAGDEPAPSTPPDPSSDDPAPPAPAPAESGRADAQDDGDPGDDGDEDTEGDDDDPEGDDVSSEEASEAARTLSKRNKVLRVERRIARLTREKHDTARERDEARQQIATLQQELQALKAGRPAEDGTASDPEPAPRAERPEPASTFTKPKPKQDDFDDFDAYLDARDAWVAEKAEHDAVARIRLEQEIKQRTDEQRAVFDQRIAAAREKFADFDAAVEASKDVPLPMAVIEYLQQESDAGMDVTYYLAKHPEEARALTTMSPRAAVAAVGRIEHQLLAGAEPTPQGKPRTVPVSKAPAPVATVRTGSGAPRLKNPDDMTQAEFNAWRDEQERRDRLAG